MKHCLPFHRDASSPREQRGSILLEALIGVLVFSLGILALIAMQARAMQLSVDAAHRGEAAFLANQYFSQMWVSDKDNAALVANFQTGGAAYLVWLPQVQATLPGAGTFPPTVMVDAANTVTVTLRWQAPQERGLPHSYVAVARIVE